MLNKLASIIVALALAIPLPAFAITGTPPIPGPALQDGTWLNGLAGGLNNLYIYGLTALGTTQATAAAIPSGYYLVEADTVAASTGLTLPTCFPGTDMLFYNNGSQTVTIYPSLLNNPVTAAQDTINNTTSITVASHIAQSFSCAKAGVWFSK